MPGHADSQNFVLKTGALRFTMPEGIVLPISQACVLNSGIERFCVDSLGCEFQKV